jgi:hypothetical protein
VEVKQNVINSFDELIRGFIQDTSSDLLGSLSTNKNVYQSPDIDKYFFEIGKSISNNEKSKVDSTNDELEQYSNSISEKIQLK